MGQEVIIVGAGLAGLTCAVRLEEEGWGALILEASDDVGGRVRSDWVDGFTLDRGFQVFLEAYPEAKRFLDYESLELRPFERGALVWTGEGFERLGHPLHDPVGGVRGAMANVGNLRDKARVAKLWAKIELLHADGISSPHDDRTTARALRDFGFSDAIIDRLLRPLFGGAMVDPHLDNSSLLFDFIFRMFGAGRTSVPSRGMQAIPRQLAARLKQTEVRLRTPVSAVGPGQVELADGQRLEADHVVVATDGPTACELVDGLTTCEMRPSASVYFAAPRSPLNKPLLVLNGTHQGPINSLAVHTEAAPRYGPGDRALVCGSILGRPSHEDELVGRCRAQLSRWFDDVGRWEHIRTYAIERSLPVQTPEVMPPVQKHVYFGEGVYVCGDHRDTASINGAMGSGRRVAEAIVGAQSPG